MILDTCALIWLAVDQSKLSHAALRAIDETTELNISSISAFEIGQKYKRGQLELSLAPRAWFNRALAQHKITVIDLSPDICLAATELPDIHKDPFDRLIIATAKARHQSVVTSDLIFEKYGVETIC